MEKYKGSYVNRETFEESKIETNIPADIVNEVEQALNKVEGYFVTPIMINPDDLSIVIGIMDMKDRTFKYKLSITPNK